jgi:hypothetical protein
VKTPKKPLLPSDPRKKRVIASNRPLNATVGLLGDMSKPYLSNRAKCLLCKEIIESKHRHHFVPCKCANLIVDGGLDYLKRVFIKPDSWIDMSETSSSTAGVQGESPKTKTRNKKKRT